jgi:hypothetical protein
MSHYIINITNNEYFNEDDNMNNLNIDNKSFVSNSLDTIKYFVKNIFNVLIMNNNNNIPDEAALNV